MRCHHCRSEMQVTDSITEGTARQTWYCCPVCSSHHTVSQPCASILQRIGNAQRCSGGAWPGEAGAEQQPARAGITRLLQ